MKDEARIWISYADENLDVSTLTLEHGYLNACLQNAQQAVEKYLKAVIIERDLSFVLTHSVRELVGILADHGITPYTSLQSIPSIMPYPRPCRTKQYAMRRCALPEKHGISHMA